MAGIQLLGPASPLLLIGNISVFVSIHFVFLWLPCIADVDIIFLHCGFFLLSFFFFLAFLSFPRLILAVGDWISTILPHMV